jgi:hypothetical protein
MAQAMQLIFTPMVWQLMDCKKRSLAQDWLAAKERLAGGAPAR